MIETYFENIRDSSARLNKMAEQADIVIQNFEDRLFQMSINECVIINIDELPYTFGYGSLKDDHRSTLFVSTTNEIKPISLLSPHIRISVSLHLEKLAKEIAKKLTQQANEATAMLAKAGTK